MKNKRKAKITEIIQTYDIENQEELLSRLKQEGFAVTQATISRDIKELRVVKRLGSSGKYKYFLPEKDANDLASKFAAILSSSVVSTDYANNMAVVKCYSGMAQGACAAIDAMHWDGLIGTIAGDDIIFALFRTEEQALKMINELKNF
ncbi:MAG: arginine repressor [Clostridia bacterium]|nr:arginine repressor [Clostridia bacterium]